jgi:hypothetical protein
MTDMARDIGYHDAKIEALENEVRGMRQDLTELKSLVSEAKGGIRVLAGVGAIGGMVGAGIVKAATWMKGGGM